MLLAVDSHRDTIALSWRERVPHHHYDLSERSENPSAPLLVARVRIGVAVGIVGAGVENRPGRRAGGLSQMCVGYLGRHVSPKVERDRRRLGRVARARRNRIRPFAAEAWRLDGR